MKRMYLIIIALVAVCDGLHIQAMGAPAARRGLAQTGQGLKRLYDASGKLTEALEAAEAGVRSASGKVAEVSEAGVRSASQGAAAVPAAEVSVPARRITRYRGLGAAAVPGAVYMVSGRGSQAGESAQSLQQDQEEESQSLGSQDVWGRFYATQSEPESIPWGLRDLGDHANRSGVVMRRDLEYAPMRNRIEALIQELKNQRQALLNRIITVPAGARRKFKNDVSAIGDRQWKTWRSVQATEQTIREIDHAIEQGAEIMEIKEQRYLPSLHASYKKLVAASREFESINKDLDKIINKSY